MSIEEDFTDYDLDSHTLDNIGNTRGVLVNQIKEMITNINTYKTNNNSKNNKSLNDQKKKLEEELQIYSTEFVDDITDINVKSAKMLTLQDWIIASFMLSYLFASLCLLFYIGNKTNWDKKKLLLSFVILLVVSLIIYSLLQAYA